MIPKSDLEIGAYYEGDCRNASVARWNGSHFIYRRVKFGDAFFEEINHPEDDDGFDLFVPRNKIYDCDGAVCLDYYG
jgi:hypothetical protein